MKPSLVLRLFILLLIITLLSPATRAGGGHDGRDPHSHQDAAAPAGLVIFGDSLSDTGNAFFATGILNRPPYDQLDAFLIPNGPYARGGATFSNGAVWIQQLARPLGLAGDAEAVLAPRHPGDNYAFGGARARAAATIPGRHLPDQVSEFLAAVNYGPSADPLYVLFIGGNDVADAVRALTQDPSGAASMGIIVAALTAIGDAIQALYNSGAGAREFLVINAPDLGLTPAFTPPLNLPQAAVFGTCFSLLFNLGGDASGYPAPYDSVCAAFGFPKSIPGLDTIVGALEANLPGTTFTRFDLFALMHAIVADPAGYRLSNVTGACIMPNVPPYACRNPDSYLFWDGIHPTRKAHEIVAAAVQDAIAPRDHGDERQRHHARMAHAR
ncbi:MAG: SGNH/GDSL hydrolase family protein [Pseudomonadota bacterium]